MYKIFAPLWLIILIPTNSTVFGFTQAELEPTIYREHANHYIIDVVLNILLFIYTVCIYTGHFTLQRIEILESDNIIKMAELTRLRDEKEKLYKILQSHLLICPGLNIFWLYVHLYMKLTQRLEICVMLH